MSNKQEVLEKYLLQNLTFGGKPFDLSLCKEVIYVETLDLSAPRLMLKIYDPDAALKNDLGLKPGDIITAETEDLYYFSKEEKEEKDQEKYKLSQTLNFKIMSMPATGPVVTINCFQELIANAKEPASAKTGGIKPANFPECSISELIKYVFPEGKRTKGTKEKPEAGIGYAIGNFPKTDSYHIVAGKRPTEIIRQAAIEKGAVCFYQRGFIYFDSLAKISKDAQEMEFEHNNPSAQYQIVWYKNLSTDIKEQDKFHKNYAGFDPSKGRIRSQFTEAPPRLTGVTDEQALSNMANRPVPVIDFICMGHGGLMPGVVKINFIWNVDNLDAPLDESLPESCIVSLVSHYYSAGKYVCRVRGVAVPGKSTKK